jgi:cell wall-associated NlpC family hydrolase
VAIGAARAYAAAAAAAKAAAQKQAAARAAAEAAAAKAAAEARAAAANAAAAKALAQREATQRAADQRAAASAKQEQEQSQPAEPATGGTGGAPPVGPAAQARTAVAAAYRPLGAPYVWAADGPATFDCSGLTAFVWAAADVTLPHSSQAQFTVGRHVQRSELAPGDLVFFGSPIHHVGIYVGGGRMIDAPQTGQVVQVQSIDRADYAGAVRVTG